MRRYWIVSLAAGCLACALAASMPATASAQVIKRGPTLTAVTQSGTTWTLTRDGKPFFITGACGSASKKFLLDAGANSFRTWDPPTPAELDDAQRLGLSVTAGIMLGTDGTFNYSDSAAVARQFQAATGVIRTLKDHPAVMIWGIGNETEGFTKPGDNPLLWKAIDNIAAAAKKLDPYHPTMTVIADVGGAKVKMIHQYCPNIDIVGINSYGKANQSIAARYRGAGGTKPFVVTEFGPPGVWEQHVSTGLPGKDGAATPYRPAEELTSTEKAPYYRDAWQRGIVPSKGFCLGGYAFIWGSKVEATATWFGLFLADGARLEGVDELAELWSGKTLANHCPKIQELSLVAIGGAPAAGRTFAPGAIVGAKVTASDPENDPLTYRWSLNADSEKDQTSFPNALKRVPDNGAIGIQLPQFPGNYRLYVYVYDSKGSAATASTPLQVVAKP
jgi:hypothetical protein